MLSASTTSYKPILVRSPGGRPAYGPVVGARRYPTSERLSQDSGQAGSASGGSAYSAEGFGGQLIVIVPERRLVVVVASQPTKDYATDSEAVFALVSDVILTRFH